MKDSWVDAWHQAAHATVLLWLQRLEYGRPRSERRLAAFKAYVAEVLDEEAERHGLDSKSWVGRG